MSQKDLINVKYNDAELVKTAEERTRTFQTNFLREVGFFYHLIAKPFYEYSKIMVSQTTASMFPSHCPYALF
jgi:hypothetical protein